MQGQYHLWSELTHFKNVFFHAFNQCCGSGSQSGSESGSESGSTCFWTSRIRIH